MGKKNLEHEKKKCILKFLKKNGESPVSIMCPVVKSNPVRCKFLLNKLLEEGKIERRKETLAIYYFLPLNPKINHGCGVGELPQHHNNFKNDK